MEKKKYLNGGGTCPGASKSFTITVNPTPTVAQPTRQVLGKGPRTVIATIRVTPQYSSGGVTCPGASKSFTITVNPTPTVVQPTGQVLCNGQSTSLITFTGSAGAIFDWVNDTTSIGLAASGTG